MKTYMVLLNSQSGEEARKLSVQAESLDAACKLLNARFGAANIASIWNEEDVQKAR